MNLKIIFIGILFLTCNSKQQKKDVQENLIQKKENNLPQKVILQKLKKLFIVGDFDGDNIQDTLFQRNFSEKMQQEIDSSASPYENNEDTFINWFYNQESDVRIVMNKKNKDTLHLGEGQGLYCLINLGDINKNGKDEIAFVMDYLDYTRVNECYIYSLCKNKWQQMFMFSMNEGAFDFNEEDEKDVIHTQIKGYLEKKNGKWWYVNDDDIALSDSNELRMKQLRIKKCN